MARTSPRHTPRLRTSVGRIAAAALALGGLSTLVLAPDAGAAAPNQTTATTISTAKNSKIGTVLVAGDGNLAVYTLKPSKTACTGKCLKVWPPVMLPQGTTAPTAGAGVTASDLGTKAVTNGLQITYQGKPLYWFQKDKTPGQVKGNIKDKWGKWAAVVTVKASGSSGGGGSKSNSGTGGTSF
jgi:predicted lipoprotein with Yx(FWY)xxD motif